MADTLFAIALVLLFYLACSLGRTEIRLDTILAEVRAQTAIVHEVQEEMRTSLRAVHGHVE
jgi:hypothetical protein